MTQLRQQVETSPVSRLAAETIRAMTLADQLGWDSLSQGDAHAFERQAAISTDLRLFGVCARLLASVYAPGAAGTAKTAS